MAADPTGMGPYRVETFEYKLPAELDPLVLDDFPIEIWAKVSPTLLYLPLFPLVGIP